jgi:hypothetical protein
MSQPTSPVKPNPIPAPIEATEPLEYRPASQVRREPPALETDAEIEAHMEDVIQRNLSTLQALAKL